MLLINNLHKIFNYGQVNEKYALQGIELQLDKNDFVSIIGSNGAGKSTLLNLIAGDYYPEKGDIKINNQNITDWSVHKRASLVGRVFQDPLKGTAAEMTIEENLAMASKRGYMRGLLPGLNQIQKTDFKEKLSLLELGLEERLETPVDLLSGGQRQALTLLMATMGNPKILLLDEHTAALDPGTAEKIIELTKKIVEENNLTVLMVTHNMKQALDMGNRTIMMDQGKIILDIKGEERDKTTVPDLLKKFNEKSGHELIDDKVLLSELE